MKNSTGLWFPNVQSWISAMILALISGLLITGMYNIVQMTRLFDVVPPRLELFVWMLALLSPITIVAFGHHLLYLLIDRFSPGTRPQGTEAVTGFWPSLSSWWEGLYSWAVMILATILCIGIGGLLLPDKIVNQGFYGVFQMLADLNKLKYLFSPSFIIWVLSSAYLYQFEFVMRRHFAFITKVEQSRVEI
jgi:hypothetical protein